MFVGVCVCVLFVWEWRAIICKWTTCGSSFVIRQLHLNGYNHYLYGLHVALQTLIVYRLDCVCKLCIQRTCTVHVCVLYPELLPCTVCFCRCMCSQCAVHHDTLAVHIAHVQCIYCTCSGCLQLLECVVTTCPHGASLVCVQYACTYIIIMHVLYNYVFCVWKVNTVCGCFLYFCKQSLCLFLTAKPF